MSFQDGTNEIDFLKETLHAQQELLQKLYNELDVERESSAIAADEALSMILRLQGEKAAMEMEASQYKRIAEEKMCHTQETLETFQELIYQKEMQIASLEFQVQAYKFKLASMGCGDLDSSEMQYPENLLSRRNGAFRETSQSPLKRGSSVPPPPAHRPLSQRESIDGIKSMQSSPKKLHEMRDVVETSFHRERTPAGDFNTYWEEIRKLDERVKELGNVKNFNNIPKPEKTKGPSGLSICNPSPDCSPLQVNRIEDHKQGLDARVCGDSPTRVQDIFEVPQCSNNNPECTPTEKDKGKSTIHVEHSSHDKLASAWDEVWQLDVKDKNDRGKKSLLSPIVSNNNSPKEKYAKEKVDVEKKTLLFDWDNRSSYSPSSNNDSPVKEKTEWGKKPLLSSHVDDELSKTQEGKISDKQFFLKHPPYGVADFELQQFNRRLKQLEDERFLFRGNEVHVDMGDEHLRLLKEITEKIDLVQSEMRSWRIKTSSEQEHPSIGCLREAMLSFWP